MGRMKELMEPIAVCALDTGYDYEYLEELIQDLVESEEIDLSNAIEYVCKIAYEGDL